MASTQDAVAAEETPLRRQRNKRLRQAVHRHKATTRQGIQERLFTLAFSGLVYPQIWEDPVVDLEALYPAAEEPGSRVQSL
jgi:S-adenosylmethionine-diacylglycerol 3-amino-3-carboxypropyl transferase